MHRGDAHASLLTAPVRSQRHPRVRTGYEDRGGGRQAHERRAGGKQRVARQQRPPPPEPIAEQAAAAGADRRAGQRRADDEPLDPAEPAVDDERSKLLVQRRKHAIQERASGP